MSKKPTYEELEQRVKELEKAANDRVNSEKQLREREEKYRFIVENSNVGIFIAQNGVLKFSNIKLQALLGYPADELVKIPYKNLLHPGDKHLVKEMKERKLQGEKLNSVYSLRIINKAEKEFWVEINSIPISWEGRQATLNFARDITLQKKLEAQLQQTRKMESIGTLAGSIAHKFNNLMTTIIGNAHMLLMSTGKDDFLMEGLEDIKSAGERAADLTRQILAFSRKQMIRPKVLDLNEVLAGIESVFVRLIEEHIELKAIYEPALGSVKMDPAQIYQVVMNLVNNARDAMPNGGTLTIETANVELGKDFFDDHGIKEQPGYYVMLSVTDTGTGMDERTQEHMFEPFYTTKEVDKGSGLGLSTVYGIIKQNDGFIQVDSEIGRGSTFKIYLPVVKDDPGAEKKELNPEDTSKGSESVLIVENDLSLRKLVCKVLDKYGYQVLEAANGEKALKVAGEHDGPIHLLISDVVMPKMSGREVADRLQSLRPEVKVLYMSGYTNSTVSHYGVSEKEANFIKKPFTPEGLALKVREVMDKK